MSNRIVNKSLAAQQDLLFGELQVEQKRANGVYTVDGVRLIYPVNSLAELQELDPEQFPKARLYSDGGYTDYMYSDGSYNKITDGSLKLKIFLTATDGLTKVETTAGGVGIVYEVSTASGASATIYSDKGGNTAIPQNGTSNVSNADAECVFYVSGGDYTITIAGSSADFTVTSSSSIIQGANKGGVYLILDDVNTTTLNDILPVVSGQGIKFGLAPYLFGISSSYSFVRLSQMLSYKQNNNGEILSHSSYHVAHDASLSLSTGNSYIKAASRQFNQFGFNVNGFVAPNSILNSKFMPAVKQEHDYAFVRSVGVTSNEAATNSADDDMYNLVRVSLESITEAQAKSYIDYAIENAKYLVFYTHTNVTYLASLIAYIKSSGANNINPSEWVGKTKGLTKGYNPTSSINLLQNTEFKRIVAGDVNPYQWTTDFTDIASSTLTPIEGTPARFDLVGNALTAGDSLIIRQNIPTGAITRYTPFCFSGLFTAVNDNSTLKVAMYLKDSLNVTIVSAQNTVDLDAGDQFVEVAEGFIADSSASYVQVELTLTAKAPGQIRCLGVGLKAEFSGKATRQEDAKASAAGYYNVLRRTTGLAVPPNADTPIAFDASLEGTNRIVDLSTGLITPTFGLYDLKANFGLDTMVAGDSVTVFLYIDGVPSRKSMYTCVTGTNIFNASWSIRGDGREYKVGIRHNSSAGRAITTFGDATLTITSSQ